MTFPLQHLPPRVERLRRALAEIVPCDPPIETLRHELRGANFRDLLFVYFQWAQRLIRPAPRNVVQAQAFWTPRAEQRRPQIEAQITRIFLGEDLSPFLSKRVHRHGYAPKGSDGRTARGIDWQRMDFAINAWGVHHLHLDERGSDELLFVQFKRERASLILLGDHKSFHSGQLEEAITTWRAESGQLEINGILGLERNMSSAERTTLARHGIGTFAEVGGKIVISSMLSTAGTSLDGTRQADHVMRTLERIEPKLDAGALAEVIPAQHLIALKGRRWSWRMNHCDLLLVEEATPRSFVMAAGYN